ncbi:MAG: alpha/beta hydrolase [Comamonas sp.]|uniref:alpha/beta hydrolase n=1 Tax=Comamonas sp. TaxID=34028 RepID=UPI0028285DFE|nr:alpha/beta hydrolase [Comamonas sp.]MDR0214076.1 alpha/beta hydrolase [Comamonas sp.]
MQTVQIKTTYWDIAADLYFPPNFDESRKYPAIISAHPIGSCKEQTAGNVYGKALAEAGFVVIAFDRSTQGQSGGLPRYTEDPAMAVEDFSRVTDYLVTLPYVDADRIGALGICGGGGYAINATMIERRIKALVSITGVNYGRLCREGFSGFDPIAQMEAVAQQRTAEARGEALKVDLFVPPSMDAAVQTGMTDIDVLGATDYYRRRCVNDNAGTRGLFSRRAASAAWDAFHLAETLLTTPMLVVVGDKPGGFGAYRDGLEIYARAAAKVKELVVVEGASHYELYDQPGPVGQALGKLVPFFQTNL